MALTWFAKLCTQDSDQSATEFVLYQGDIEEG